MSQRIKLTSSAYSLHARSVADSAITGSKIAGHQVVRSINSLTDEVKLEAGENVTIRQKGKSSLSLCDSNSRAQKGLQSPST